MNGSSGRKYFPGIVLAVALTIGCAPASGVSEAPMAAPTTTPTTAPATAPSTQSFQDSSGLIRLEYPAGWKLQKDPDYVLSLVSGRTFLRSTSPIFRHTSPA